MKALLLVQLLLLLCAGWPTGAAALRERNIDARSMLLNCNDLKLTAFWREAFQMKQTNIEHSGLQFSLHLDAEEDSYVHNSRSEIYHCKFSDGKHLVDLISCALQWSCRVCVHVLWTRYSRSYLYI